MTLRNLSASVLRLAQQTVALTRPGAVTINSYGVASQATGTTTTGLRCVATRPARTSDLMHLSEGDRLRRTCSIVLVVELRIKDIVTLEDGEQYEIQGVSPHPYAGFYTGVGVRITEQ